MANNLSNATANDNINPSLYQDGYQKFFGYVHENPDAKVVLNRGTNFEQDLTDWLMSFSTSNSVDDIVGSFNVVLNNENDRFVDRYNNTKIATASSIEIFAKISNAPKGVVDNRLGTNSDIITIGENLVIANGVIGPSGTVAAGIALDSIITQYYGSSIDKRDRDEYKAQIIQLNASRTIAIETMSDPKSDAMFGDVVDATDDNGRVIKLAFNGSRLVDAKDFFTNVRGREGQSAFFVTDLEIETNGSGGFVKNPNGTYKFRTNIHSNNQPYPIIRQALIEVKNSGGQDSVNTVFKPVVKSKDVPFLADEKGNELVNAVLKVGDMLRIPPTKADYRRVFFGVVTNVSQNIAPATTMTVTLSGKSLGYWLESSVINVQPAVEENQYQNLGLSFFANRYADSTALDIFRDLIRFSTDDLVAVSDYSLDTNSTATDFLLISGQNGAIATDPQGRVITSKDGKGNVEAVRYSTNPQQKEQQLQLQKEQLFTDAKVLPNYDKLKKSQAWTNASAQYKSNITEIDKKTQQIYNIRKTAVNSNLTGNQLQKSDNEVQRLQNEIATLNTRQEALRTEMEELPEVKAQIDIINYNLDETQKQWANQLRGGRDKLLDELGIEKHWQRIFANIILEVLDSSSADGKKGFLANVYPFRWDVRSPGWMDGDYQNKASIGQTIAQNLMYEFYFDTNGHFVLKPPLYSISQQNNDSDYIITDRDVYSININDTIDGIITRVGVAGAYFESPSTPKEMIYNVFQDFNLIKNYGVHSRELSNLLFIRNNSDCRSFGRAFMSKNNVELKNASVTIYGRPEIRLGTSIYLQPRDTVYYVKGISHDFNVGDGITTTLTLVGARRIIRGFRAKKKVKQYYKILQSDGTFTLTDKPSDVNTTFGVVSSSSDDKNSVDVEHYVPVNATNFTDLPLSPQPQINALLNRQLNADNNDQAAEAITDSRVILLQNMYVINSHPNAALIGILVDSQSALIGQINKNYYDFLNRLVVYSETEFQNGINELKPHKALVPRAAAKIKDSFLVFVGAASPNVPSGTDFITYYGFTEASITKVVLGWNSLVCYHSLRCRGFACPHDDCARMGRLKFYSVKSEVF